MINQTMYRIHKWIAVTAGSFLLLWLITGIVMVAPLDFLHVPFRQRQASPISIQEVGIAPAEAVSRLSSLLNNSIEVTSVTLQTIADSIVYQIRLANGETHLIKAKSGQTFTITAEIAEQIARDYVPSQTRVLEIETVTEYSYAYQYGPLPAFRIVFENSSPTAYYVSTRDGRVSRSDRWNRVLGAIESLHVFRPLKLFIRSDSIRMGLLILLSLVGVAATATGYYLAVPRRHP